MTKNTAVAISTKAMLDAASNPKLPRDMSNPMSCLNSAIVSAGAPANTESSASSARLLRNSEAMWLAGTIPEAACIPAGMVPVGMYIPARNPISMLMMVKNPENAPVLLMNDVIA